MTEPFDPTELTDPFDPTEFRQWLYAKPCAVCAQPVTWRGWSFVIRDGNEPSWFLYCPVHRREPTKNTETVEPIGDRADIAIAMMATPEGLELDEQIVRDVATLLRERKPS